MFALKQFSHIIAITSVLVEKNAISFSSPNNTDSQKKVEVIARERI